MKKILGFLFGLLLVVNSALSAGQATTVAVMVTNSTGVMLPGSSNFFTANSNMLNAAVAPPSGPFSGDASGLTNLNATKFNTNTVVPTTNQPAALAALATPRPLQVGSYPGAAQSSRFRTPPMGFITWFTYENFANEYIWTNQITQLYTSGLVAAGYNIFLQDDGWQGFHDINGCVTASMTNGTTMTAPLPVGLNYLALTNWPLSLNIDPVTGRTAGLKPYIDWAHTNFPLRVNVGLYMPFGTIDCAKYATSNAIGSVPGNPSQPGFFEGGTNHWSNDIATISYWGADYYKFENCGGPPPDFINQYLANADPTDSALSRYDIEQLLHYVHEGSHPDVYINASWYLPQEAWLPSEINSWRMAGDSLGTGHVASDFVGYSNGLYKLDFLSHYAPSETKPYTAIDPDAIINESYNTNQLHVILSGFAMLSAPLWIASPSSLVGDLENSGMISIDQDQLVQPAWFVGGTNFMTNTWGNLGSPSYQAVHGAGGGGNANSATTWLIGATNQVMAKNLGDVYGNKKAVCFLNRGDYSSCVYAIKWQDLGFSANAVAQVYDCWASNSLGYFQGGFTNTIGTNNAGLYLVTFTASSVDAYAMATNTIPNNTNSLVSGTNVFVDFGAASLKAEQVEVFSPINLVQTNLSVSNSSVRQTLVFRSGLGGYPITYGAGNWLASTIYGTQALPTNIPPATVLKLTFQGDMSAQATNVYVGVSMAPYSPVIDVDAQKYFTLAGATNQAITSVQSNAVNSLIINAKAHSWWSTKDLIYGCVGTNCFQQTINFKNTNAFDGFTNGGALTFTAAGITGDGVGLVDTGFNGSTAPSPNYALNSASLFVYNGNASITANKTLAGVENGAGTSFTTIIANNTAQYGSGGPNATQAAGVSIGVGSLIGFVGVTRTTSTLDTMYVGNAINSVLTASDSQSSVSVPNQDFALCARGGIVGGNSTAIISYVSIGSGPSAAAELLEQNDVINYEMALGRQTGTAGWIPAVGTNTAQLPSIYVSGSVTLTQTNATPGGFSPGSTSPKRWFTFTDSTGVTFSVPGF